MSVILFIFIIEIRWILASICRLCHARWNSNEVLITFSLFVALVESSLAFGSQEIVISLIVCLHLLSILIIIISITVWCNTRVLNLSRLAGSPSFLSVRLTSTIGLRIRPSFLIEKIDIMLLDGNLLLIEHGYWAVWSLIAHVRLRLDLKRVTASTCYILGSTTLSFFISGQAQSLVERAKLLLHDNFG